jgi:hypothetical protein
MFKCDFFGRWYETVILHFYTIIRAKRNEVTFVHSYFKQLCKILTYVNVNVLIHSKHHVFVTSNERMLKILQVLVLFKN